MLADREQVKTAVIDIIADVAIDDDTSNIEGDVALRDQLDLDSMDFLDIVMELKKRYQLDVPKEDYEKLATLDSCVEYLAPKLIQ